MEIKYVYVENSNFEIARMFIEEGWSISNNPTEVDLICLDGGSDVTPALYGEENTFSVNRVNADVNSLGLISIGKLTNTPVVGICRGAQILHVSYQGKMDQHITGHGCDHDLVYKGRSYEVCCGHHQGMIVTKAMEPFFSTLIRDERDGVVEVWSRKSCKTMGFQPHPEWSPKGSEARKLFFDLIEKDLGLRA